LSTDLPFLLVSPSLLQVVAELWVSMAVQLLVAGLCKGELVDGDEGDGSVVCCYRPLRVLRWEEAGKVRTASPKLVVKGIGCCCVTWWRLALMETEGEEDAAEGKPSVLMGLLGEGEKDGATVLLLLGLSRYGFKGRGECAAVWGRKFPTEGAAV